MNKPKDYSIIVLAALAVIGTITLLVYTRIWGAGVTPDSVIYLSTAQNIAKGNGFIGFNPINNTFPPLFPLAIAFTNLFGLSPTQGARILNALIFGGNILLVGLILKYYSKSLIIAICGALTLIFAKVMIYISFMVWTEPLFIFLILLGMFQLTKFLDTQKRSFFIASAIITGIATITRYAGLPFIASFAFCIFLFSKSDTKKRIFDSISFFLISSSFLLLWFIRILSNRGTGTVSGIIYTPLTSLNFDRLLYTFSYFLLPAVKVSNGLFIAIVTLISLSALTLYCVVKRKMKGEKTETDQPVSKLPLIITIAIIAYTLFIFIVKTFMRASVLLDDRTFSPVYVLGLILILSVFHRLLQYLNDFRKTKKAYLVVCTIIFLSFFTLNVVGGSISYSKFLKHGFGFSQKFFNDDKNLFQSIKKLPANTKIYTNSPYALYYLTGKRSDLLPFKKNSNTFEENESCADELQLIGREIKEQKAVIVYFLDQEKHYALTLGEITSILPLTLVKTAPYKSYAVFRLYK
jgi:hypothetical protein